MIAFEVTCEPVCSPERVGTPVTPCGPFACLQSEDTSGNKSGSATVADGSQLVNRAVSIPIVCLQARDVHYDRIVCYTPDLEPP